MRQHTTPWQTNRLIELGFEEPKYECFDKTLRGVEKWNNIQDNYSIGELIEMLPDEIYVDENTYSKVIDKTDVCYYSWELETYAISICDVQEELIDNLYDMILKLKKKGVI